VSGWLFNPLNAELNPICHLLALLGGETIVVVSRLRVKKKSIMMHGIMNVEWSVSLQAFPQYIVISPKNSLLMRETRLFPIVSLITI